MGKKILMAVAAVIIAIQIVPVDRGNPPVEAIVAAPPEVLDVLKRACFDCHSNETTWPWYSYVAPVSWIVAGHVEHAREEMNFTDWTGIPLAKRAHKIDECWEMVEKGEMPLSGYVRLHAEAKLSDAGKALIRDWARVAGESSGGEDDGHEGHNH
jgi:hypothetical protein